MEAVGLRHHGFEGVGFGVSGLQLEIWVVVKIRVPFWEPYIIGALKY